MTSRLAIRTLAVCLIGAAMAMTPQTASARHWGHYRGGFGGWGRGAGFYRGGFYRGGFGRGFYRRGFRRGFYGRGFGLGFYGRGFYGGGLYRGIGFYPRYYGGFYPRYYRRYYPRFYAGIYPGYYGGYYGGYYPRNYGGYYGYPVNYGYGRYGVCGFNNYGLNTGYAVNNSGYASTVASSPPVIVSNTIATSAPKASSPQPSTAAGTLAYYLQNNPYRQDISDANRPQSHERSVSPSQLMKTASFNPYAATSQVRVAAKTTDLPPAPGF